VPIPVRRATGRRASAEATQTFASFYGQKDAGEVGLRIMSQRLPIRNNGKICPEVVAGAKVPFPPVLLSVGRAGLLIHLQTTSSTRHMKGTRPVISSSAHSAGSPA
jgi:hypothetical protein